MHRFNYDIDNYDKIILQKILDKLNSNYSMLSTKEMYMTTDLLDYFNIQDRKNLLEFKHLRKCGIIKFIFSTHDFRISINPIIFDNGIINFEGFIDFKNEIKKYNYNLYLELCGKYEVI